jgi:hypothetical protein
LFENHLSNTRINFTKCSWHRIKKLHEIDCMSL